MNVFRCKCGATELVTSENMYPCSFCYKCFTSLETGPNMYNLRPTPHRIVEEKDRSGTPYHYCKWCLRTIDDIKLMQENFEFEGRV